jgi:hypothetical protein
MGTAFCCKPLRTGSLDGASTATPRCAERRDRAPQPAARSPQPRVFLQPSPPDTISTARGISSAGEHLPGRQGVRGSNPRCSTPNSISRTRLEAGSLMRAGPGGTQKGTQSAFEYSHGTVRQTAAESSACACAPVPSHRTNTRPSKIEVTLWRSFDSTGWLLSQGHRGASTVHQMGSTTDQVCAAWSSRHPSGSIATRMWREVRALPFRSVQRHFQ